MQEYPVKRGFSKNLDETVAREMYQCFGTEPGQSNGHYQITFGALNLLDVSIGKDGKSIIVKTESKRDADDTLIIDTNRRFRQFLDHVTGYSTKERVKRAKSVE
jgi:hypothetical protein